jgi:hypothetical protein
MSRKHNGYVGLAIPCGAGQEPFANAIFDAVGMRLREASFTPKRVLAGLQKKT